MARLVSKDTTRPHKSSMNIRFKVVAILLSKRSMRAHRWFFATDQSDYPLIRRS